MYPKVWKDHIVRERDKLEFHIMFNQNVYRKYIWYIREYMKANNEAIGDIINKYARYCSYMNNIV